MNYSGHYNQLKRDYSASEFFCHKCQKTRPRAEFNWTRKGFIKFPCKPCTSEYRRENYKRRKAGLPLPKKQYHLGKIEGDPTLKRCLGPCGRVLPVTKFPAKNMPGYRTQVIMGRKTWCWKCDDWRYGKKQQAWRDSQTGFRVCDVCHVDRPAHHYLERKHTCTFCFALMKPGVRTEDTYLEIRQQQRSQRFACT
jgi:hypothetical protein